MSAKRGSRNDSRRCSLHKLQHNKKRLHELQRRRHMYSSGAPGGCVFDKPAQGLQQDVYKPITFTPSGRNHHYGQRPEKPPCRLETNIISLTAKRRTNSGIYSAYDRKKTTSRNVPTSPSQRRRGIPRRQLQRSKATRRRPCRSAR